VGRDSVHWRDFYIVRWKPLNFVTYNEWVCQVSSYYALQTRPLNQWHSYLILIGRLLLPQRQQQLPVVTVRLLLFFCLCSTLVSLRRHVLLECVHMWQQRNVRTGDQLLSNYAHVIYGEEAKSFLKPQRWSSFLCNVTQLRVVVRYRRFETTLKMGAISFPETSVRIYLSAQSKIPKERRSDIQSGACQISHMLMNVAIILELKTAQETEYRIECSQFHGGPPISQSSGNEVCFPRSKADGTWSWTLTSI
jgi:hypothetical protein